MESQNTQHPTQYPATSSSPNAQHSPGSARYVVHGPNGFTLEVNSLAEQLQALQALAAMTGIQAPAALPVDPSHALGAPVSPTRPLHAAHPSGSPLPHEWEDLDHGHAPSARHFRKDGPWDPARFRKRTATPSADVRPLTELMDEYLGQLPSSGMLNDKGQYECAFALKHYIEITGDKPMTGVTRADAVKFVRVMERWPKNLSKLSAYKGMTPAQILDTADLLDAKRLSPVTVNNKVGYVRGFFEYVRLTNVLRFNPFDTVALPAPEPQYVRIPFTAQDLAAIFDPTNLRRLLAPQAYWLPVLAHYTGCRLRELSQLYLKDIETIVDIPVVHIADRFPNQRIKNWASRRVVPLHPELIGLGFLDYVDSLRGKGETHVFPGMPWFHGDAGFLIGKRLNETYYRKVCGLDQGMTFHCHRHHFIDQAAKSGLADPYIARLSGHALEAQSVIRTNYIQASTLPERYQHLLGIPLGPVTIPPYDPAQFEPYFALVKRNEMLVEKKKAPRPIRVISNPPRSKAAKARPAGSGEEE
ncbi:site-specific integrase [Luteibacter sp. CQ10]|uniref:site-specific integrase n=1 Tax=Luteibacter sp. CQ10 TaxID=2805821 RepID=UPI0034A4189D